MGKHSAETNRKDPMLQPLSVSARNPIERFFNKIKQCGRVATRYDKLAANYLVFVKLASIRIWLGANESAPWIFSRRLHFAARMRPRHGRHPDSFAA